MKDIVIIGAGGFGREVKTIIDAINIRAKEFNFLGFYDDNLEKGTLVNSYPILGNLNDLQAHKKPINVVLGIGDPETKLKISSALSSTNSSYPNIIHPSVHISSDGVVLGKGCVICAGTILTCNIEVKDFVTLNLLCTVGHDTVIGNYASFMPSVNISGEVVVHDKVYVGTGATIINQVCIGTASIIGAGAVVVQDIPAFCTAVGIPAKPIKFHDQTQVHD